MRDIDLSVELDTLISNVGLVMDLNTTRIPVVVDGRSFDIEAHSTPDGCLLRCDVDRTGPVRDAHREWLNQLGTSAAPENAPEPPELASAPLIDSGTLPV